jgi:hypothetical protein
MTTQTKTALLTTTTMVIVKDSEESGGSHDNYSDGDGQLTKRIAVVMKTGRRGRGQQGDGKNAITERQDFTAADCRSEGGWLAIHGQRALLRTKCEMEGIVFPLHSLLPSLAVAI